MAQLNFAIKSAFDGEGFRAATEALNQNKQEINAARAGLGDLTNALSDVSPAAASGVSAIKSFAQAFAAGGIVGGAIQLAIKGVSTAIEYFTKKAAEAKEATTKWGEIVRSNLVGLLDSTNAKFKETSTGLSNMRKDLDETVKLLNGDINAQVETKIHNLHIETLQQITDGMSESGQKVLEAQAKAKEALIKANAEVDKAKNNWEAQNTLLHEYYDMKSTALKAEKQAEAQYAEVVNNCSTYLRERERIELHLQNLEENYAEGRLALSTIEEARKTLGLKIMELEDAHKDEVQALANADKALKEAHQNVTNTESEYERQLEDQRKACDEMRNANLALKEAQLQAAKDIKEAGEEMKEKVSSQDVKDLFANVNIDAGFSDEIVDLFKDVPDNVDDIKETSKETSEASRDIKRNQNKYGARGSAMNVAIDNFQPGSLPTIQEIREQRQEIESAPARMADEATKKYGYPLTLYLKKLSDKNGKLTNEDVEPFKDVITGVKSLPEDVAATVVQNAAGKLMMKEGYRNFFSNIENIKKWLDNGKKEEKEADDYKRDIKSSSVSLASINSKLANLGIR